jgi:hypothetical protein
METSAHEPACGIAAPTGCVPPNEWELAGAAEIERLTVALQKIANLPLEKTATFKRKPDPVVRARRIAVSALKLAPRF